MTRHFSAVLVIGCLAFLETALGFEQSQPRRVAVVVGVSEYMKPKDPDRSGFKPLNYAHSDAERMATALKDLGWDVTLLVARPDAIDAKEVV